MTDFNKLFEKEIEKAIAAKEQEIKDLVLKNDHDAIKALLNKKIGVYSDNLIKLFGAYKVKGAAADAIYNHLYNFYKEATAAVDGKDKHIPFITPTVAAEEKGEEAPVGRKFVKEVIVDGEGRIRVTKDVLDGTDFPLEGTILILRKIGTIGTIYIVPEDFNYDTNKYELVKERELTESSFRIGVGKLLDVVPGMIVGIDVYEDQLVLYNTDAYHQDTVSTKETKKTNDTVNEIKNAFKKLGINVKNITELTNKKGDGFVLKAFAIDI